MVALFLTMLSAMLTTSAATIDRTFFYHRTPTHDIIAWYTPQDTLPLISHQLHERTAQVSITIPRGQLSRIASTKLKALLSDLPSMKSDIYYDTAQEFCFSYNPRQYAISVYTNSALGRFNCFMIAIERLHERARSKNPGKTIILDPGHGGHDVGAVSVHNDYEKDIALAVSTLISKELESAGYTVYMTRHSDAFVELDKRTDVANGLPDAAVFVSIHANAATNKKTRGFEILYPELKPSAQRFPDLQSGFIQEQARRSALSILLAKKLSTELNLSLGNCIPDRGRYGTVSQVLTGTKVPSVLIELGYLSCPEEAHILMDHSIQQLQAVAIARGIIQYVEQLHRA
jgi:N-acetylmuramoyl-L-alanine amidase